VVPSSWVLPLSALRPSWPVGLAATTSLLGDRERSGRGPAACRARRALLLLVLVVGAVTLPAGLRELALVALALGSYLSTPRAVHEQNHFSLGTDPRGGGAVCRAICVPGAHRGQPGRGPPGPPLREPWQLFWSAGALSTVLDNARTYAAFVALARGLSHAEPELVAGVALVLLAAVSVGSVVMGATTYIGNGPNLMVRAVAQRAGVAMPSFGRYALFALLVLLPLHLGTTLALLR
jgi:hypothetical protein